VLTQSPQRTWASVYGDHPDHLAAGEAAACAVYPDARNPFAHPELLEEGFEPHTVRELWLMAAPEPTVVVDITPTFERKLAALRRHESQVGPGDHLEEMLREWNGTQSRAAGLPEGRLAEGYRALPTA
jgi:LmbE family N-acetylglucosaminyl deacetylase